MGLRVWARGELNHLTTPVNTGLQAVDPVNTANREVPRGTSRARRAIGWDMSHPSFNLTRARSALGSPNRKTDDWAPTTPRPAVSIVGNVRFCPQAVTVGGPATARSVTERATAGSVPAPVTELRGSASFEH